MADMEMYKKILVAVDDSETSLKAAESGINLSVQLNAKCAIVFVIDSSETQVDVFSEELPRNEFAKLMKKAVDTIKSITAKYPELSFENFTPEDKPSEGIVNIAEEWHADLIVMGTIRKSGIKHLFLGSTAENTIRRSKIPVLVVPNTE